MSRNVLGNQAFSSCFLCYQILFKRGDKHTFLFGFLVNKRKVNFNLNKFQK